MYYRNPSHNPDLIPDTDWKWNMGVDIIQLLLLTEGVFNIQKQYNIKPLEEGFDIVPQDEVSSIYYDLINKVDENLKQARIIDITGKIKEQAFVDACIQDDVSGEVRNRCYRLTLLTANINGTHPVPERDTIAEFYLFYENSAKYLIYYLFCVLKYIINRGIILKDMPVEDIVGYLNRDYDLIYRTYENREKALWSLRDRSNTYQDNTHFKNEEVLMDRWIERKIERMNQQTMLQFILDNEKYKEMVIALLEQIISVIGIISEGNANKVLWKDEVNSVSTRKSPHSFSVLKYYMKTLEDKYDNESFNKQLWAKMYLRQLDKWYNDEMSPN